MLDEGANIAVVGGGIAGITSAYLLQRKYNVTLFESEPELGGHTHTVSVNDPTAGKIKIDMGFIVLNDRNYPLLNTLLKELEVSIQPSEMSFGFYCDRTRFAYSGMSLNGLFANRSNLVSPAFYSFLNELRRFARCGIKALHGGNLENISLGKFISLNRFSEKLKNDYIIPMGSAIWSCGTDGVLNFPAQSFLTFFKNHGLLEFSNRPNWQTVTGGSSSYVDKFKRRFKGKILTGTKVIAVERKENLVVKSTNYAERYAAVVLATHASTSLKILDEPTELENAALSPWRYSANKVSLHTDVSFLPPNRRGWASWNYRRRITSSDLPTVSYWMNNLQNLKTEKTYCVTLNEEPPPEHTIQSIIFEHPVYTSESIRAQQLLPNIQGTGGVYYAGAYFGDGFHEDGCRSSRDVSALLGVKW